jgi:hypothetical protein
VVARIHVAERGKPQIKTHVERSRPRLRFSPPKIVAKKKEFSGW